MSTVTVNLGGFHDGQKEILASTARFRVVCAGRRWGKTRLAAAVALQKALAGGDVVWTAPTHELTVEGQNVLDYYIAQLPMTVEHRKGDRLWKFENGGSIKVITAGTPRQLVGKGYNFVVYDEAAFGDARSWYAELRPALADRKGGALFISTPAGKNWFYDLFELGQDSSEPQWASWQRPSSTNPFLDSEEIEEARRTTPQVVFLAEWEAQFLDEGMSIFRAVDVSAMAVGWDGYQAPVSTGLYISAFDVARKRDATCGIAARMDVEPYQVVKMHLSRGVPWAAQQRVVDAWVAAYGRTVVESNGPGDVFVGNLRQHVDEFITSPKSKVEAVHSAQVLVENGCIKCGDERLLRRLKEATWQDRHHSDEFMAFVILAHHLPPPGRVVDVPEIDQKHLEREPETLAGNIYELEF